MCIAQHYTVYVKKYYSSLITTCFARASNLSSPVNPSQPFWFANLARLSFSELVSRTDTCCDFSLSFFIEASVAQGYTVVKAINQSELIIYSVLSLLSLRHAKKDVKRETKRCGKELERILAESRCCGNVYGVGVTNP